MAYRFIYIFFAIVLISVAERREKYTFDDGSVDATDDLSMLQSKLKSMQSNRSGTRDDMPDGLLSTEPSLEKELVSIHQNQSQLESQLEFLELQERSIKQELAQSQDRDYGIKEDETEEQTDGRWLLSHRDADDEEDEDEEEEDLVSHRISDESDDEEDDDSDEDGNLDEAGRRRRRRRSRRRRRISFKKTVKSVKKASSKVANSKVVKSTAKAVSSAAKVVNKAVAKPVTKTVKSAAKTTSTAVIKTANKVGNAIASVANTISSSVRSFASQVVQLAKDVGNALSSLINFKCFSPQKLFTLLFLPSSGVDQSKSSVDLMLSGNPKIKATIAPKMGDRRFKQNLRHTSKLYKSKDASITMKGGADIQFSPRITMEVDAVSGKVKVKFDGSLQLRIFADVTAKKKYTYKKSEKFPKKPMQVTGCVPGFCIALLLQGIAKMNVKANAVGSVGADLNATFGVSAEIELDVFSGKTVAKVSGGKLTHQEQLIYKNTFDGSFTISGGPILTLIPMPGAPISVKPSVTAEIKAHASMAAGTTSKTPCGTAAINVRGKTVVEGLGIPKDMLIDANTLSGAVTADVAKLPSKMNTELLNMMTSCLKIPGANTAIQAMNTVVQKLCSGLSAVVPNFRITFGNPMTLLQPAFCLNVLKVTVPKSAGKCGKKKLGCSR